MGQPEAAKILHEKVISKLNIMYIHMRTIEKVLYDYKEIAVEAGMMMTALLHGGGCGHKVAHISKRLSFHLIFQN